MTTFLFIIGISCSLAFRVDGRCIKGNKPGKLQFSVKMNAIDFGNIYRYTKLDCCATGYDSLIWYHRRKNYSWEPYPFSWGSKADIGLQTASNQTLYMRSTPMQAKGEFKCVARNSTTKQEIFHKIIFGVDDKYGRYAVIPYRPQQHVCVNSGNISVTCKADFGHLDSIEKDIDWYFIDKKKEIQQITDSRVTIVTTQKNDNTVTEVVLNIVNITEKDVGSTYLCAITSTLNDGKSYQFNTTLIKCDQENASDKRLLTIIVSMTLAVIVMAITPIVVVYLCKDRIGQTLRPRFPKAYFNIIGGTNPDLGDKTYHTFVHHSDAGADRELALELRSEILANNANYNIAITCNDVQLGRGEITGVDEVASQAATLFLILPVQYDNDENDNDDNNVGSSTLFDSQVSSILCDYFQDHKNSVTVICPTRAERNYPSNRMREIRHVIAGDTRSPERRRCVGTLIMRMPLPSTSPVIVATRQPENGHPQARPLLKSTDSVEDDVISLGNYANR